MRLVAACVLVLVLLCRPAAPASLTQSRFFTTSDGVRLHYLEAGPPQAHTIVFVPGWTMPAWIWERQIEAFAPTFHVIAFDPRGQGDSEVARTGYEPGRRGRDIAELIEYLGPQPVLAVAWSLGVLDTLAYVHVFGDARLAGLVLVDNSIGENPPPPPPPEGPARPKPTHADYMRGFVRKMFRSHQSEAWLDRLTRACLRTPEPAANALLAYPVPRTYWREAVYATDKPVLYVVRPRWAAQAENLVQKHKQAESVLFTDAGHALFVDQPARFDAVLRDFMRRKVWK
jgi:non-heme chloroperoxidase